MYTYLGRKKAERRIQEDLNFISKACLRAPFSEHMEALILMGGYARGEGTCLGGRPYNDYDLILIGDPSFQGDVDKLCGRLSQALLLPVDMQILSPGQLRSRQPSLMDAEMKYGHKVLLGPANILDAMSQPRVEDVPSYEGLRLLLNRGALLLHVLTSFKHFQEKDFEERRKLKFLMKCHLAMGDAELMRQGRYTIRYIDKVSCLQTQDAFPGLAEYYREAVRFKLTGDGPSWSEDEALRWTQSSYREYVKFYRSFCRTDKSLRNLYRSIKIFRSCSFEHPRFRLLDALILILEEDRDLEAITKLLGISSDNSEVEKRFFHLWENLA